MKRASAIVALLGGAALLAPALAGAETGDKDGQGDGSIVVTASRIARAPALSAVSVDSIDGGEIDRAGQINIADALRRLPDFAGGSSPGNGNFRSVGFGENILDLRGLGISRTLVLVNGQRMVGGLGGTTAVDINMIPTERLERVEVVTGGTSALYGSDAVAGVVNFVLKTRFTGAQLDVQSGISAEGDLPRQHVAGIVGSDFAQGRGNIWLDVAHDHDGGLFSSQRALSATDPLGKSLFSTPGAFNLNGTIYNITGVGAGGVVLGNDYSYGADGQLKKGFVQASDGFDRDPYRRISVPLDRTLVNGGLSFDVSPSVALDVEGLYGETRTSTAVEPYPSAGGDPAVNGSAIITVPGGLALDNAFIPPAIAAEIAARNSDADPTNNVSFIAFRRRLSDIALRDSQSFRRTWRATATLKGEAGGAGDWHWSLAYVFGHTNDRTATPTIVKDRFLAALDAVALDGTIVCRNAAARAAGCQPLDIFGSNSASAGAVDYVTYGGTAVQRLDSSLEEHVVTAGLTGTVLHRARLSVGAEYRHESAADLWDANTQAGNVLGTAATDTVGSYGVASLYGEMVVPLLSGRPFARALGVEGAVRRDGYSSAGDTWSWRVGGNWTPVEGVAFRVAYAQASRAPNVVELYATRRQSAVGTATLDPCNGVTATRANPLDNSCRAIPGIAQAIAANGAFTYSAAEIQGIVGYGGGNPGLRPEEAHTLTAGVTLTPGFLRGLALTADYHDIRITGAIGAQAASDTASACLVDPASAACGGLVQRLSDGKISEVDSYLVNSGAIRERGMDVTLAWRLPMGGLGAVALRGRWTHLFALRQQAIAGGPWTDALGQLQDAAHARFGSSYRDRFTADALWSRGVASLSWTVRYLGPIVDTLNPATAPAAGYNLVPAAFYHDAQLRVRLDGAQRRELYFGVDNLFDRDPPFLPGDLTASGLVGVETSQDYDAVGRYFYVGATLRF